MTKNKTRSYSSKSKSISPKSKPHESESDSTESVRDLRSHHSKRNRSSSRRKYYSDSEEHSGSDSERESVSVNDDERRRNVGASTSSWGKFGIVREVDTRFYVMSGLGGDDRGEDKGKGKGKSLKSRAKDLYHKIRQKPANWRATKEGNPQNRKVTNSTRGNPSGLVVGAIGDQAGQVVGAVGDPSGMAVGVVGDQSGQDQEQGAACGPPSEVRQELAGSCSGTASKKVPARGKRGRFAKRSRQEGDDAVSSPTEAAGSSSVPVQDSLWRITGSMPGGPTIPDVIPSYGGHIACMIWKGAERTPNVIECLSRKSKFKALHQTFAQMREDAQLAIAECPLFSLLGCMYDHIDASLIAAFVERWQPDTNTFHLPIGEMTIMLHDVEQILGLSATGMLPPCPSDEDLVIDVEWIFGGEMPQLRKEKKFDRGGIVDMKLRELCIDDNVSRTKRVRAFHLSLLGNTLLADKSRDKIRPHAWRSTENVGLVAWAPVALAFLYRQLGQASRACSGQIGGCLTLLQAWIYEYFPIFRPASPFRSGRFPRATSWDVTKMPGSLDRLVTYRHALDRLSVQHVIWTPYADRVVQQCMRTRYTALIRAYDVVESYNPGRVVRQLGYVQHIPAPSLWQPTKVVRSGHSTYILSYDHNIVDIAWNGFPRTCLLPVEVLRRGSIPGEATSEYVIWYPTVTHLRLINKGDDDDGDDDDDDTDTPPGEYWLQEFGRRLSPLLDLPYPTSDPVPVPREVYDPLYDLIQQWQSVINFDDDQ